MAPGKTGQASDSGGGRWHQSETQEAGAGSSLTSRVALHSSLIPSSLCGLIGQMDTGHYPAPGHTEYLFTLKSHPSAWLEVGFLLLTFFLQGSVSLSFHSFTVNVLLKQLKTIFYHSVPGIFSKGTWRFALSA